MKDAWGPGIRQETGFCGKLKLNFKTIVWITSFTGENKKNQAEFLTFFEVYVLSQWNFSWSIGQFFGICYYIPYKKSEELPLACLYLMLSLGYSYPHPTFVQKVIRMLNVLSVYWFC